RAEPVLAWWLCCAYSACDQLERNAFASATASERRRNGPSIAAEQQDPIVLARSRIRAFRTDVGRDDTHFGQSHADAAGVDAASGRLSLDVYLCVRSSIPHIDSADCAGLTASSRPALSRCRNSASSCLARRCRAYCSPSRTVVHRRIAVSHSSR